MSHTNEDFEPRQESFDNYSDFECALIQHRNDAYEHHIESCYYFDDEEKRAVEFQEYLDHEEHLLKLAIKKRSIPNG